jgi:hypothetical protein
MHCGNKQPKLLTFFSKRNLNVLSIKPFAELSPSLCSMNEDSVRTLCAPCNLSGGSGKSEFYASTALFGHDNALELFGTQLCRYQKIFQLIWNPSVFP